VSKLGGAGWAHKAAPRSVERRNAFWNTVPF
jgi:hypothetical protein